MLPGNQSWYEKAKKKHGPHELMTDLWTPDRANRPVDDAVNMALHFIHQHLDSTGTYSRILLGFLDFSSTFDAVSPALLQDKLS